MTTFVFPDNTLQQDAALDLACPDWEFLPHWFLGTDLAVVHYCRPITPLAPELSWEPVILPLLERLAELRSLPETERWLGVDWPVEQAFGDAGTFAERLPVPLKALPHISLADDGEVNFAWSFERTYIDLGFYGTRTFSYYARDQQGNEWFGDEISVTSPLPTELKALLAV